MHSLAEAMLVSDTVCQVKFDMFALMIKLACAISIRRASCHHISALLAQNACRAGLDCELVSLFVSGLYLVTSCSGFDGSGCQVCLWDRRQMKQMWQFAGHQQAVSYCAFMPSAYSIKPCSLQKCSVEQNNAEMQFDKATVDKAPVTGLKAHMCELDADQRAATDIAHQPALCLTEDMAHDAADVEVATDTHNIDCMRLMVATASADCTIKLWQYGRTKAVNTLHTGRCAASRPTCVVGASSAIDANGSSHGNASMLLFMGTFHGDLLSSAL